MSQHVLLFDFGSTYTKVMAVDLAAEAVLGWAQSPSTVDSDIARGATEALAALEREVGLDLAAVERRLACSSAAGGLRIVASGLVRQLTAEAARSAALGAGGKLVGTYAQSLSAAELCEIETTAPDIVLLAGGTDGGNEAVIRANAATLAASGLTAPIIVAGNKSAQDEVAACLRAAGKEVHVTENVMPELGVANVVPAREVIRQIFIDRIVVAKGLAEAEALVGAVLMPTPLAVSDGARLLAEGTAGEPGLGELVVVDIGGATTDVHSLAEGRPRGRVVLKGLAAPFCQRTVEGDMGMRISAAGVLEAKAEAPASGGPGLDAEPAAAYVARLTRETAHLPHSEAERQIEHEIARTAVAVACARHAGRLTAHYLPGGETAYTQLGKDLTEIATVVGTGGIFGHVRDPGAILRAATFDEAEPFSLRPKSPRCLADGRYLLFGAGLLATVAPDEALRLLKRHLTAV
ncbi:MAG: methylaspartate mutase accessory protein GlmL [Alphaproteobacteria bacterium]|nr:methylaspartate mutase accessory protein GlmL [Alphaproteobacteria bacterium]